MPPSVLCEYLDVMLGAESDDKSRTLDQPWVANRGVVFD